MEPSKIANIERAESCSNWALSFAVSYFKATDPTHSQKKNGFWKGQQFGRLIHTIKILREAKTKVAGSRRVGCLRLKTKGFAKSNESRMRGQTLAILLASNWDFTWVAAGFKDKNHSWSVRDIWRGCLWLFERHFSCKRGETMSTVPRLRPVINLRRIVTRIRALLTVPKEF